MNECTLITIDFNDEYQTSNRTRNEFMYFASGS